jgi:inositol-polyphosphate multikinase
MKGVIEAVDLLSEPARKWMALILLSTVGALSINMMRKSKKKREAYESDPSGTLEQACKRFEKTSGRSAELDIEETKDFEHQVAGHTREVLLKFGSMILKPRLKTKLFLREVTLYEEINESPAHALTPKTFLPKYFGTCTQTRVGPSSDSVTLQYLALEDLTRNFKIPCAMDVKMGTQTFEPSASSEKKARELTKYTFQKEVGFRITGYKSFDAKQDKYHSVEKSFGRSLHPSDIENALKKFFSNGIMTRRDVLRAVIAKLEQLLAWFNVQRNYHFYCSSILIVYEGSITSDGWDPYNNERESEAELKDRASWSSKPVNADELVQVKMIDLAHTLPAEGRPDVGYTHGLNKLITYLYLILESPSE